MKGLACRDPARPLMKLRQVNDGHVLEIPAATARLTSSPDALRDVRADPKNLVLVNDDSPSTSEAELNTHSPWLKCRRMAQVRGGKPIQTLEQLNNLSSSTG